ncbi:MAG: FAD-dependent oxidoreductase [Planctomycetes bacterium]|nr:FAD-dependent oxidoreductase [Planctomycetota bacterium]
MGARRDAVVVGGGLAGLAAATLLGRAGRQTLLLERAARPGGRAATQVERGFHQNLGPHALYVGGPAEAVLKELGVAAPGGRPPSGGLAVRAGRLHRLPEGPASLLATGVLGWSGKLEASCLLARLPRLDAPTLDGVPLATWLDRTVTRPDVRALLEALARVATYADDPTRLSAGLVVRQLQAVVGAGVRYVDGGWQALVDGLARAADGAGVEVRARCAARELVPADDHVVVRTDGGDLTAGVVVVAAGPAEAHDLLPADPDLARWRAAAAPVRAACLDLGLSRLPRPRATFVVGIDRPLYLSVHSAAARLAPEGAALIHVAKYLAPDQDVEPAAVERELDGLLDLAQPGWRDAVVTRRLLPRLTVTHAAPLAAHGGVSGRPGPALPRQPRVLVAGDWVGPEGHLADAALSSARAAARAALAASAPSG